MNQLSSNLSFLFVGKISEFLKLNYSWCTILYKLQVLNIVIHNFLSLHSTTITTTSLQSCPTLCDPTDGSPPGSPTPGILQARTLEWVAISFSNAGRWKVKVKSLSRVWPSVTPWTAATRLLCPWDFPGKSTGVGCHCLLWCIYVAILFQILFPFRLL